ncbi:MAG: PssD/Cps14F family polysaccharide biosynthesis glycosyltransferase [Halobacteriota archaeon]|nr:PssD/Cps14F family polysaccharide biosynthesis glycosyltransferase [Halobacteriota archaeon]
MKICLVCSHGGHLTEMLHLMDAFEGNETFFITYEGLRADLKDKYLLKNIGKSPIRMLLSVPKIARILLKEKPDMIISTGSEIAIPVFYIAKVLMIKTVFIESWCRVSEPSASGRIVYPVSDLFLVQWEQLLKKYGKKAIYRGAVF